MILPEGLDRNVKREAQRQGRGALDFQGNDTIWFLRVHNSTCHDPPLSESATCRSEPFLQTVRLHWIRAKKLLNQQGVMLMPSCQWSCPRTRHELAGSTPWYGALQRVNNRMPFHRHRIGRKLACSEAKSLKGKGAAEPLLASTVSVDH